MNYKGGARLKDRMQYFYFPHGILCQDASSLGLAYRIVFPNRLFAFVDLVEVETKFKLELKLMLELMSLS